MILDDLVAAGRATLEGRRAALPEAALREGLPALPPAFDVAARLRAAGVSIVAEVKRASPSRGSLNADLDPAALAVAYARAGAAAVSVLTEESRFRGSLADLEAARAGLRGAGLDTPLLRKDFIVDPYQLVEARIAGADAALLIAAVLTDAEMERLLREAADLGLTPLVEVHDASELRRVLPLRPPVIGINNRNLTDFVVDLDTTRRLRPLIPPGIVVVSESGIGLPEQMAELARLGVDAVLIGEALVTAPDPAERLAALLEAGRLAGQRPARAKASPWPMTASEVVVKICGLTNLEDARHAWRAGADLLGFVLVAGTPRYVKPEAAATLVRALRDEGCGALMVGLFAHESPAAVRATAEVCGFDLVQIHGDPSPAETAALGVPALVARRVRGNIDWAPLAAYRAWGYVLDGYDPVRLGGTGRTWDWALAADRPEGTGRVLIAGGLTPENVAAAVRAARPWGVDVSSGVESLPGRKDPNRVARFIEQAKGA